MLNGSHLGAAVCHPPLGLLAAGLGGSWLQGGVHMQKPVFQHYFPLTRLHPCCQPRLRPQLPATTPALLFVGECK